MDSAYVNRLALGRKFVCVRVIGAKSRVAPERAPGFLATLTQDFVPG
jgi:hypothetical protein